MEWCCVDDARGVVEVCVFIGARLAIVGGVVKSSGLVEGGRKGFQGRGMKGLHKAVQAVQRWTQRGVHQDVIER